ncbi:CIC_collapsed_G0027290.mRNA.1.CDS.1 [Saccharomyces cerevisiae]|nr:CIC_collapsed_G0027290.mRNA.1.CDS.1 [Saccharomyces cerevisiae]
MALRLNPKVRRFLLDKCRQNDMVSSFRSIFTILYFALFLTGLFDCQRRAIFPGAALRQGCTCKSVLTPNERIFRYANEETKK